MILIFLSTLLFIVGGEGLPSNFEKRVRDAAQPLLERYAEKYNTSFQLGIAFDGGKHFEVVGGIDHHATKTPMKENTLIPMGSATKIYTAVAVMQLHEKGLLDIDRPVHEIVDPFLQRTNSTTLLELWGGDETINRVTTRELMGMRGCLSDYDDEKLQNFVLDPSNAGVTVNPYDYLHTWAQKSFLCEPGTGGSYSSIGFVILGLVCASSTNATQWSDFDQKSIFPDSLRQELDELVFSLGGSCSETIQNVGHQYAATFTSNGYWNTIHWEDIYNFDCLNGWTMGNIAAAASNTAAALYHLFSPNTKTPLVTQDSLKQMMDFKPLTVGWSVGLEYGLGMMRANYFPRDGVPSNLTTFVGHAGQDYGSSAFLHQYNEALDVAITLSSNTEYGMNCSLELIMDNFQDSTDLGCIVWDSIVQIATNGTVQHLTCAGERNRRHRHLAAQLPLHCEEPCTGESSNLDQKDCETWKEFHAAANGAYWARFKDNFADPCGISDVECEDGHITVLNLSYVGAASTIPDVIGSFSKLQVIDLGHNYFFGSVPQSIANLLELNTLVLSDCLLSSALPPTLDYSKYDACEISGNDFSCPLPVGSSDSCSATCDKGPDVSFSCGEGLASIQGDRDVQAAQTRLDQAIGSAEGTIAEKVCAAELKVNRTCTINVDLSDPSLKPLLLNFTQVAEKKSLKLVSLNLDKKQQCENFGPCEIRISNTSVFALPHACDNDKDLSALLSWIGRPSQCIESDFGSSCVWTQNSVIAAKNK